MKRINRRQAIGAAASAAASVFLTGRLLADTPATETKKDANTASVQWNAVKLDAKKVAPRAYELYAEGSCMYASFTSLGKAMAEATAKSNPALSKALTEFPYHLMRYGHSGMGGQGTLCGAVNGSAAFLGLFVKDKALLDAMIAELCGFYEITELPIYHPQNSKLDPIDKSVATCVLCHVSQMHWCKKSGHSSFSEHRTERCKRLTADCITKAIEILNRYVDAQDAKFVSPNTDQKACITCHGKGGIVENISAKMNCTTCHVMEDHY